MEFNHCPVMKNEAVEYLQINPGGIYIDCTLGGGSHSLEIVKKLKTGRLIAVDRDADAIEYSEVKLKDYKNKIYFIKNNFVNIKTIVENIGIKKINGALMDLGLSSYQIDQADRGFSYMKDSVLRMTMDKDQKFTADFLINSYDKNKIKDILYTYGEEKFSGLIAGEIVRRREIKPFETSLELADAIKYAVRNVKYDGGHPAKRSFQAIRCYVNQELENIEPAIDAIVEMLVSGGRLVVISFHSGEDVIVKKSFRKFEKPCVCPPDFPVCICGKKPEAKIITKKPVYPGLAEIKENPRSESAKLRVLEKL